MATTFSLAGPSGLFKGEAATFTLSLDSTAASPVNFTLTATGGGTFSSPVSITTGQLSTTFTYTPALASGVVTITAVAAGGFTGTKTLAVPMHYVARETSANKIISQALGMLGVKAPGQPINGNELNDLLPRLNSLIDAWRVESLYAYATQTVTGLLKGGTKTMTIGPTGDIVVASRPIQIQLGSYFTSSNADYPLAVMNDDEYNGISYKTVGSLGPNGVYYQPGTPNGTLSFFPQAAGDISLSLSVLLQLEEFADATTTYVLAPGYERALALSFAEEISPDYGLSLPPNVARAAALARRNIKRANMVVPSLNIYRSRGNIVAGWSA